MNQQDQRTVTILAGNFRNLCVEHITKAATKKNLGILSLVTYFEGRAELIEEFRNDLQYNPSHAFNWLSSSKGDMRVVAEEITLFARFYAALEASISKAPTGVGFDECLSFQLQKSVAQYTDEILDGRSPIGHNEEFYQKALRSLRSLFARVIATSFQM